MRLEIKRWASDDQAEKTIEAGSIFISDRPMTAAQIDESKKYLNDTIDVSIAKGTIKSVIVNSFGSTLLLSENARYEITDFRPEWVIKANEGLCPTCRAKGPVGPYEIGSKKSDGCFRCGATVVEK